MKRIESANKDYIGRVQFFVRLALIQQFPINQALIKTAALGQVVFGGVGALHLDIVDTTLLILHIDIQTDTFAIQPEVDGLFEILVMQRTDFDSHNLFNQMGTKPFIAHDMLEEKVVTDG